MFFSWRLAAVVSALPKETFTFQWFADSQNFNLSDSSKLRTSPFAKTLVFELNSLSKNQIFSFRVVVNSSLATTTGEVSLCFVFSQTVLRRRVNAVQRNQEV